MSLEFQVQMVLSGVNHLMRQAQWVHDDRQDIFVKDKKDTSNRELVHIRLNGVFQGICSGLGGICGIISPSLGGRLQIWTKYASKILPKFTTAVQSFFHAEEVKDQRDQHVLDAHIAKSDKRSRAMQDEQRQNTDMIQRLNQLRSGA